MFTASNRNIINNGAEKNEIRTHFVKKITVFHSKTLACILNVA